MAKETKEATKATEKPVELTVDNIRESLGKGLIGTEQFSDTALEEIKKEKNERTVREMKTRFQKVRYKVIEGLLKLRHQRDVQQIQHEELSQYDRLARFMMGFTFDCNDVKFKHAAKLEDSLFEKEKIDFEKKTIEIVMADGKKKTFKDGEKVPPILSYVDFDNLREKILQDTRKKTNEADAVYRKDIDNLNAEFGDYYDHSWRY